MLDFSRISFICHVRVDTYLREKNIRTIYDYYNKHTNGECEFIFVEDDKSPLLSKILPPPSNNITIDFIKNDCEVHKSFCYNRGAKLATREIFVFLDVDVILDTRLLFETISEAIERGSLECLIGYNGIAIYCNTSAEQEFLKSLDIEDLYSKINDLPLKTMAQNQFATVGNTQAVGGCLCMTRESFKKINGFNPLFKGWGYEDNEIISRANKLGLQVCKSSIANNYLFHLQHETVSIDKSKHKFYKNNGDIVNNVECMSREELEQYIKKW